MLGTETIATAFKRGARRSPTLNITMFECKTVIDKKQQKRRNYKLALLNSCLFGNVVSVLSATSKPRTCPVQETACKVALELGRHQLEVGAAALHQGFV